jgi:hypothetical protein
VSEEKALIPFKGINLGQVQKRIDKALVTTRRHYDTEPRGVEFETFVWDLFLAFPQTKVRYDVVFASVMDLAGKRLTRDVIKDTAWRLSGNTGKLIEGVPVPPFVRQTELEWCPVTIVRCTAGRGYDKRPGFYYEYRVMAGQPAGMKFTTFWSAKYTRFVARSVGFRRGKKIHYKLADGAEMVRMRIYFLFDPKLSKEDRPTAYHFYVPPSMKAYNQQILKQRYRLIPCPLGYLRAEMSCHHCPQGYDQCLAGCHPITFTVKPCPRCKKPEAWFDPLGRGIVCVECEEQERRRKHDD